MGRPRYVGERYIEHAPVIVPRGGMPYSGGIPTTSKEYIAVLINDKLTWRQL